MSNKADPMTCVSIEHRPGYCAKLFTIDGIIECSKMEAVEAIVKRENLTVVPRSELRAIAAKFMSPARFASLFQDPSGRDSSEVRTWKSVARLQEKFRTHGTGWAWWSRFLSVNSATTCLDVIRMLSELSNNTHRSERRNEMPVDWLGLLRQAVAETTPINVGQLRSAICRELDEDAGG